MSLLKLHAKKTLTDPKRSSDPYLNFFKKNLHWLFLSFVLVCVVQFIFLLAAIFNEQHVSIDKTLLPGLESIVYIGFIYCWVFAFLLIYPCYLLYNKAFIADLCFIFLELFICVFIIGVSLYGNVDRTIVRVSNTKFKVTVYLTYMQYAYLQASNWLSLICVGGSFIASIVGYYFAQALTQKPWHVRTENEKVISKPKN